MDPMRIDCHTCPVRGRRCDDCVVIAFASLPIGAPTPADTAPPPAGDLPLDAQDRAVIERFVASGLLSRAEAGRARSVADDRSWREVAG